MPWKRVSEMTPDEYEKYRAYQEEYRKTRRKKKKDYAPEEWREFLDKINQKRKINPPKRKKRKSRSEMTPEELKIAREKANERNKKKREKMSEEEKNARREYQRKWARKDRVKNKEKYKIIDKKYRLVNKNKIKNQFEKYYEKNKEKLKEYSRNYYYSHREHYLDNARRYRENNPEKIKAGRQLYNERVKYDNWAHRLTIDEAPIRDASGYMLVQDFHTKEYFYPKRKEVYLRVRALEGKLKGEFHLYANEQSKRACPVFRVNTRWDPHSKERQQQIPPIDPLWRKTVIERANGHCERCGKASDILHAHHIIPKGPCGMLEEDFDNGIALCPECHLGEGGVHDIDGCRLHELAAEKREAS